MCIDLLPEKLLQAIKKKEKSQLLLINAKIFKSYILIPTCELFRI